MKKKTRPFFGDNRLSFSLPDSWEKLTQKQLYYVLFALTKFDDIQAKTYIFLRLLNIKVLKKTDAGWLCRVRVSLFRRQKFFLQQWEIQHYLYKLDFINDSGVAPVRFEQVGKYAAVDSGLHNLKFKDYIHIENYYQGFLACKEEGLLLDMGKFLYRDKAGGYADRLNLNTVQLLSVVMWFSAVKNLFAIKFPCFFQRVNSELESESDNDLPDMEAVMNAEIRALTGGDATKENQVLELDCWRALTELNEKARESQELNKKYVH